MVFGAALAVFMGWLAGLVVIAWEGWQFHKRGALKSDYWADWFFWTFGIAAYSEWWFSPAVVALGGAWMFVIWAVNEGVDLDEAWYDFR